MNNKFSIITVSFNSARTIERTILSVLNQSCLDFEYLIIDGGSTDGTIDIIKKYQDRISYWISEKDMGISDAFNKGILASRGGIVGILNSDDWYEPNALEVINRLDSGDDFDFYVGALRYWDNDKTRKVVYPDTNYMRTIRFCMPHLNHPASFFTRKTYDEIGLFDIKYKYAMDYDIFLRAYLKGKRGAFTNEIISNMLMGGAANMNREKTYWEVFKISKSKILGLSWYLLSLVRTCIFRIFNKEA